MQSKPKVVGNVSCCFTRLISSIGHKKFYVDAFFSNNNESRPHIKRQESITTSCCFFNPICRQLCCNAHLLDRLKYIALKFIGNPNPN